MARPKGSKNKPKDAGSPAAAANASKPAHGEPGHNRGELTDEQRQKLHLQHVGHYKRALEAKKAADAAMKNVCKAAKADLGDHAVAAIKTAIFLETPEGQATFKTRIEAELQAARWAGLPVGHQDDMFADRRPAEERAYDEGRADGMAGANQSTKWDASTKAGQEYLRGWGEGQAVQLANIKPLDAIGSDPAVNDGAEDEDRDLRPAFLRESENVDSADPLSDARH